MHVGVKIVVQRPRALVGGHGPVRIVRSSASNAGERGRARNEIADRLRSPRSSVSRAANLFLRHPVQQNSADLNNANLPRHTVRANKRGDNNHRVSVIAIVSGRKLGRNNSSSFAFERPGRRHCQAENCPTKLAGRKRKKRVRRSKRIRETEIETSGIVLVPALALNTAGWLPRGLTRADRNRIVALPAGSPAPRLAASNTCLPSIGSTIGLERSVAGRGRISINLTQTPLTIASGLAFPTPPQLAKRPGRRDLLG